MGTDQFHTVLYHWLKPFLEILKGKDLPVSPDTHIQLVRMLEAFKDKITAENLPDFLAAVVVKNAEQMKILKQAYDDFPPQAPVVPPPPPPLPPLPARPLKYKYVIAAAIVLASLAALIIYLIPSSHSANAYVEIIHDRNVKHPVMLSALPGLEDSADAKHLHFHWDFGDGTTESGKTRVEHTYEKPGNYIVSLKIASHSPKVKVDKADTSIHLTVCPPPPQLNINSPRVQTSEPVIVTAKSSDSTYPLPRNNAWYINEKLVKRSSKKLDTSFRTPGDYTIRFVSNDTDSLQCDEAITQVNVETPSSLFFNISESGPQINENNAAAAPNTAWLWALGLISLASVIPLALVSILFAVKNRASKTKAKAIISNFTGTKKPKEIPFKNQDDLVEDEKDLLSVIRVMNRRNPYEQTYLDIPQTINSTIRSEGMVQPVWRTRTRPVEYLVLIDKNNSKNLQVRLFEYLLKKFSNNSIYFEKYYFKGNPETCYNAMVPGGTGLQQLHDRYPNHVLIVLGTGHELVNHDYPTLNDRLVQLFRKWEHSAICTPVCYKDWDYKEELIGKAMMILPADLNAQILLFRLIESNSILPAEALANLPGYSAKYNFEDVAEIEKYLNDPFLLQWLCALAVYPLLQWDVMIAIGSALQKNYYSQHEVNYSVLLKLVRISWMQNGSFPGRTRLELLKKLESANEKLARETVLKLIDQAAAKMDSSSFAYEQLETQRITNTFLLSANSPGSEHINEFRDFKTLWEQDKIHDVQLIAYLKKAGTWSTLIEEPIDRYLKDPLNVQRKKVSRIRNVLSAVTAVCLIMFTILMMGSSTISGTKIDKLFHFTVPASGEMGTLSIAAHNCTELFANTKDSMVVSLPNNITYSFGITDSAHMTLDLRYFAGTDSMIRFSLTSDQGVMLDTTFKASRQHIELAILGCPAPVPGCGRWILTTNETRNLEGAWYDESILLADKRSYMPVTIVNSMDGRLDSIDLDRVVEYYRCSDDSNQVKAITINPRGIFEVVYLQSTTGVSELKYGTLNHRFASIREARSDTSRPTFTNTIFTPFRLTQYTGRQTATELEGTWTAANGDQFVLKGNSVTLNRSGWRISEIDDLPGSKLKLHRLKLSGAKWLYIFNVNNDKVLLSDLQDPGNAAHARAGTVYT